MKTIFLLAPLVLFLFLGICNLDIFLVSQSINIFFIFDLEIPVLAMSVVYFWIYVLSIWLLVQFSDFFKIRGQKKAHHEINSLKAELYDKQEQLITKITQEFKDENTKNMTIFRSENEKISSQIMFDLESLKNKNNEKKIQKSL